MAQRTSGSAYDFALFESAQAAPQRAPARPKKMPQRPVKVPEPRKTPAQRKRENIDSMRRTVKAVLVSGLLLSLLGGMLYSEVRQDELTHDYRDLENQMAIAQSENIQLNMELNAKLSLDKVEAYAREKLGMVKSDAPAAYINIPEDNEVLLAGGESQSGEANAAQPNTQQQGGSSQGQHSLGSVVKEFLAYLF